MTKFPKLYILLHEKEAGAKINFIRNYEAPLSEVAKTKSKEFFKFLKRVGKTKVEKVPGELVQGVKHHGGEAARKAKDYAIDTSKPPKELYKLFTSPSTSKRAKEAVHHIRKGTLSSRPDLQPMARIISKRVAGSVGSAADVAAETLLPGGTAVTLTRRKLWKKVDKHIDKSIGGTPMLGLHKKFKKFVRTPTQRRVP